MVSIQLEVATAERWPDVVAVFGRRGDDPGWCWCRRFLEPPPDAVDPGDNRAALRSEIQTAAVAPGVIAYVDGVPAGWTRVMPRSALPGVLANRALQRVLPDDLGAWWVTCFAIDRRSRGRGVASALLEAAVTHARNHGATAIEGQPVDSAALKARQVSGSALFTGTMRTFLANGFVEIARTYPSRPVMRRQL